MRGWMIAAVSTLVASGAWAGLRVGTERAPEPKVVPVIVEGGYGFSEPIDAEGYTEMAVYKENSSKWHFYCQPISGLAPAEIKVRINESDLIGFYVESDARGYLTQPSSYWAGNGFKDLRCPRLVIDQRNTSYAGPDTLGYIYLK